MALDVNLSAKSAIRKPAKFSNSALLALGAICLVAVAFGGGGSKYGLSNLVVQLTALGALWFHRQAFIAFWATAPITIRALVAGSIVLPIIYAIPLPTSIWSGLPGRELVSQSLGLIDSSGWTSLSVDPIRTLLAASALIVPLAIITIGWSAPRDHLITAGWLFVGLGIATCFIGIPQALSTGQEWLLYPENHMPSVLFGTFANRNSTGLFLVAALTLAATLPAPSRLSQGVITVRIGLCALLIVAIVLTRSRTALVLAAIPVALGLLRALTWHLSSRGANTGQGKRGQWLTIAAAIAIAALTGAALIGSPGRINDVLERFDQEGDSRTYIWEDTAFAAQRYWPIGSGTGTFDDVFHVDESLENLTTRRPGRAHNDYLEVAVETGIFGPLMIAAWFAISIWLAWNARHSSLRWVAWSGASILLAIALQSITDYPLRNLSLLAFASFAVVLLARFGSVEVGQGEAK